MGSGRTKRREEELAGVNLLELAPRRLAEWEEVESRVVVLRPDPTKVGLRGWFDRFFHKMSARRVRLDEIGTFAWKHLDGVRTVAEVAELMKGEFGSQVEPAEERLGHFVRLMRKEGFLAYPGWDHGNEGVGL